MKEYIAGFFDGEGYAGISKIMNNGTPAIERHHQDYSKPLEVKFLCVPCHRRTQRGK